MTTSPKEAARREREREHAALMQAAASEVAALAKLVRGRQERAPSGAPLEIAFAAARPDPAGEPALPAGVWVALRQGDLDAALAGLIAASTQRFVLGERQEFGDGYRLRTVEEVRMLPDLPALRAQLASMMDVPVDVMTMLGTWGPDDPRTLSEIDLLLDDRFGPPRPAGAAAGAPASGEPGASAGEPAVQLSVTVAELAAVLQLSGAQSRVLATLLRHAVLTVIGSPQQLPEDPPRPPEEQQPPDQAQHPDYQGPPPGDARPAEGQQHRDGWRNPDDQGNPSCAQPAGHAQRPDSG